MVDVSKTMFKWEQVHLLVETDGESATAAHFV